MTKTVLVPGVEAIKGRRVVAVPTAIDIAIWPPDAIVLRLAPDEVLVIGEGGLSINDRHAIIEEDSSLAALELSSSQARDLIARLCDWEWSTSGKPLSQGLMAAIPVKVWSEPDRVLVIVATSYIHEVEERLR